MTSGARQRLCGALVLAVLGACAAQMPTVTPGTGTITVGVVTSGPDIAALVFRVVVDGNAVPRTIRADAGVLTTSLPVGDHVVTLGELPRRCRIDGDAERRVTVSEGRGAPMRFTVICE